MKTETTLLLIVALSGCGNAPLTAAVHRRNSLKMDLVEKTVIAENLEEYRHEMLILRRRSLQSWPTRATPALSRRLLLLHAGVIEDVEVRQIAERGSLVRLTTSAPRLAELIKVAQKEAIFVKRVDLSGGKATVEGYLPDSTVIEEETVLWERPLEPAEATGWSFDPFSWDPFGTEQAKVEGEVRVLEAKCAALDATIGELKDIAPLKQQLLDRLKILDVLTSAAKKDGPPREEVALMTTHTRASAVVKDGHLEYEGTPE